MVFYFRFCLNCSVCHHQSSITILFLLFLFFTVHAIVSAYMAALFTSWCKFYEYYLFLIFNDLFSYLLLPPDLHPISHYLLKYECPSYVRVRRRIRGKRLGRGMKSGECARFTPPHVSPEDTRTTHVVHIHQLHTSLKPSHPPRAALRQNHHNLTHIPLKSYNRLDNINLGMWNAHSMKNKSASICEMIFMNKLDVLTITETCLNQDGAHHLSILLDTLNDYQYVNLPRPSRGGGIAVLLRKGFEVGTNEHGLQYSSFEHLDLTIKIFDQTIRLITIYRPPPTTKNKLTVPLFLEEFSDLLELLICSPNKLIFAGDFNFHLDVPTDPHANQFRTILSTFGLEPHNRGPTHKSNHILDVVITRCSELSIIKSLNTICDAPSDHFCIVCNNDFPRPKSTKFHIFRKNIDLNSFLAEVEQLDFCSDIDSVEELVNKFNSHLSTIPENHAPIINRTVGSGPHAPWYTDSLRETKRYLRKLERRSKKTLHYIEIQLFVVKDANTKHHWI